MVSQRDAYKDGFDTGYDMAYISQDIVKNTTKDQFISEVAEAEDSARQFSPFEFTAAEFNRSRNPDALWDAYEEGVMKGITKAANEIYKKEPKKKTVGKFGARPVKPKRGLTRKSAFKPVSIGMSSIRKMWGK